MSELQQAGLAPIIPSFDASRLSEAWEILGQKEHYITQMHKEFLRRGVETNQVHDELLRLQGILPQREAAIEALTQEVARLQQRLDELLLKQHEGRIGRKRK